MTLNLTIDHDDFSPFGAEDHILRIEFRSFIITIIFFTIGLFGNLMTLIINGYILRQSNHRKKCTFENFLLEISCFDLIVLLYHLINSIIRYKSLLETNDDQMIGLINMSTVYCKLLTCVVRVSALMSHWLILVLLLNRLFLVYPMFYQFVAIVNAKYAL